MKQRKCPLDGESMNLTNYARSCGILAVAVGLGVSGCASTSVFKNYPSQVNPVITSVKQKESLKGPIFVKETQSKDKTVYLMERGRVQQLYGNVSASKTDFEAAIAAIRENDEKAKVSVSDASAQTAAVMLNDNAIPYNASGYERVMLRYLQTLNFLANSDLDGARVEIANADAEQKDAADKHSKEIEKAEKNVAEERGKPQKCNANEGLPDFSMTYEFIHSNLGDQYAGLDEGVGKVKNSFQNGAAYYLSGLIYEALKDNNNAYISYKQALELNPENKSLQQDVARIAMLDARSDDLNELKTRFSLADVDIKKSVTPEGSGCVVIMYEDNFVAQKQEIKMPIPVLGSQAVRKGSKTLDLQGAVFIAFPLYKITPEPALPLLVKTGENVGETMRLCSINVLANKDLKEKLPIMITRQVARFIAKVAAVKIARDKGGDLAGWLTSAVAGATENADLRSWLTLPQDIQVCRLVLAGGEHDVTLSAGSGTTSTAKIKVQAGKTTLVRVVGTASSLTITSSIF